MVSLSNVGSEFTVNTLLPQNQVTPSIARLSDNNFVVVWNDELNNVRGQDFAMTAGAPVKIGPEFQVNVATYSVQLQPNVTALSATRFVVTWLDFGNERLEGQAFNFYNGVAEASGAKFDIASRQASTPQVSVLSPNEFLMTWADSTTGTTKFQGQFFSSLSATPAKLGAPFSIGFAQPDAAYVSTALVSPTSVVEVWRGSGNIHAQLFSTVGDTMQKLGGEVAVDAPTGNIEYDPVVTVLSPTTVVITWTVRDQSYSPPRMLGQAFTVHGDQLEKYGAQFVASPDHVGDYSTPSMTALSATTFALTWIDTSIQYPDIDVRLQTFSVANGAVTPIGPSIITHKPSTYRQLEPDTANISPADFAVVWTDRSFDDGYTSDVKGQIFSLGDPLSLASVFKNTTWVDPSSAAAQSPTITLPDGSTVANPVYQQAQDLAALTTRLASGAVTRDQADVQMRHYADATTSVATLSYEFFTGATPTAAGYSYLVNSSANASDLNDPYYVKFGLENRYINFAVNLGKLGAGASDFQSQYGSLTLSQALTKAYGVIFGSAPDAAKVDTLLNGQVVFGGQTHTRAEYFAAYGLDGLIGIGTKAAMVGFLMAEAVKAGIGPYATANAQFLADLSDGAASFNVDLISVYGGGVQPGLVGAAPAEAHTDLF